MLSVDRLTYLVLAEADEMLDQGFGPDVERILAFAPKDRQTVLLSATVPEWVHTTAAKYLRNPELVAVDTRPRIEELLGPALALNRTGLVTVEGARLLDDTAVPGPDEETKLTVYLGRQERAYRVPAFVAVCDLLHRRGLAAACALLGVDGTAHGERRRARFFARNADVPVMVIAVAKNTMR